MAIHLAANPVTETSEISVGKRILMITEINLESSLNVISFS